MSAFKGRKITLEWDGEEVAGVREKSVALAGEPVDVTSDEDGGWRTLLAEAGQSQVDISVSGVTKSSALRDAWFAGGVHRQKEMTLVYPDGSEVTGLFNMVSFNETGPYNDATTFEASFQSAEEIQYAEAAAPVNTIKPAISGVAETGEVLTAYPGKWTGARTFTYQWKNAGVNLVGNGATTKNYTLQSTDEGDAITVTVTATNGQGSANATSAAVTPVA